MNNCYSTQKFASLALSRQHQTGAVLIISLIILLAMTLLGVASMNTSMMQERMASNAQNTNITFQAAESAVSSVISTVVGGVQTPLSDAMGDNGVVGTTGNITAYDVSDPGVDANFQVTYLGVVTLTSGNSMDSDTNSISVQVQRFDIAGTGTVTATNAQTVIRQGIEYQ